MWSSVEATGGPSGHAIVLAQGALDAIDDGLGHVAEIRVA
jgi:hypothetical protein